MSDAYAGRYWDVLTNSWSGAYGHTNAPRAQLWAWQPSSLSLQPVQLDNAGSLLTSATLSGNAGNAAAGTTGVAVPASADYGGWNSGGTLVGTSTANPLPVQVISGGGGGTQYADGATQATPTGTVALGKNPSNILHALSLDGSGNLLAAIVGTVPVSIAASVAVTGTFWQATQPISAVALPLPTGAATAAKQPALGIAGTPSTDVISVQGVAGGTAVPVSGTVAVNNFPASQTVTGTFWQTTQPVSIAAMPTTPVTGTFWQATQPVSAVALPLPAGAATSALQSSILAAIGTPLQAGGAVSVSNFPATQNVAITGVGTSAGNPLYVSGATGGSSNPLSALTGTPSLQVALAVDSPPMTVQGAVQITNDFTTPVPVTGGTLDDIVAVAGIPIAPGQGVPVSIASLPLPAGAATSALQSSIVAALGTPLQAGGSVNATLTGPGTSAGNPVYVSGATGGSSNPLSPVTATAALQVALAVDSPALAVQGTVQITNDFTTPVPVVGNNIDDIVAVAGIPIAPGQGVPVAVQGVVTIAPVALQPVVDNAVLAAVGTPADQPGYGLVGAGGQTMVAQLKAMSDTNTAMLALMEKLLGVTLMQVEALNRIAAQLGAAPVTGMDSVYNTLSQTLN